ncbi:MAG: hypothetical protein ACYC21_04490 [Eubacteriales bacterium]
MINKKHIITVLLVLTLIVVVYFATASRFFHGGDRDKWIKDHGAVAARHADLSKFCLDCHKKRNETKENFCNKCHQQYKIKLVK